MDKMAKEYNSSISESTYVISNFTQSKYVVDVSNGSKIVVLMFGYISQTIQMLKNGK